VVAGKLTAIIYKNLDGDNIAKFTGLRQDWSEIDALFRTGNIHAIDDLIFAGGHKFVGVDNTELAPGQDFVEGDTFLTGSGNDTVLAKDGGDYITDRGGKDIYNGGAGGGDQLSYETWFYEPYVNVKGIVADLSKGTVKGPDGFVDTIIGIEQVRGTFRGDKFIGDDNDNRFIRFAGKDSFDGGGGFDTLRYDQDRSQGGNSGIVVDLGAGTIRDGFRTLTR
jgi:hypothetical protein